MPTREEIRQALATLAEAEGEGYGKGLTGVLVINKSIPKGWKPTSNAPYYKEKHAVIIKNYIDQILADTNKIITITPKFIKPVTQYHKYVQGFMFLVDHMDTEEKTYFNAKANIEISRTINNIIIRWRDNPCVEEKISTTLEFEERKKQWMHDLEEFLVSSSDGDRFVRERIFIKDEEQEEVRRLVGGASNFHIKRLGRTVVEIVNKNLEEGV